MEQTRQYCDECEKFVLATRQPFNHLLHGLITLFTFYFCGGWLWGWIIMAMNHNPPFLCQRCGSPTTSHEPKRHKSRDD